MTERNESAAHALLVDSTSKRTPLPRRQHRDPNAFASAVIVCAILILVGLMVMALFMLRRT